MKLNIKFIFGFSLIILALCGIILDEEIGIQIINFYHLLTFIAGIVILSISENMEKGG